MENVFYWDSYATWDDHVNGKTTGWKIVNSMTGKAGKLYRDFDKMERDLKQMNMLMKRAIRRIEGK